MSTVTWDAILVTVDGFGFGTLTGESCLKNVHCHTNRASWDAILVTVVAFGTLMRKSVHSHTVSAWGGGGGEGGGDTIGGGGGSANREPGSYEYIYIYIYRLEQGSFEGPLFSMVTQKSNIGAWIAGIRFGDTFLV